MIDFEHLPDYSGYKVMAVDDVEFNVTLLKAILTRINVTLSEACNGQDALEKIAKDKPDLVLTDLQMPVMDGIELTRNIKSNPATADISVVAVTAFTDKEDVVMAGKCAADEFIAKPVILEQLLETVTRLLDKKPKRQ